MPRPSASRTRAICSARSFAVAGVGVAGLRRRSDCRADTAAPAARPARARRAARAGRAAAPSPSSWTGRSPSAWRRRAGRPWSTARARGAASWNSIGSARAESIAALMPATYAVARAATPGRQLARLALGDAAHAERAHQPVGGQGVRARRTRTAARRWRGGRTRAARAGPAPWQKPSANVEVVRRARADVRDAEAVAQDVDRRLQPGAAAAGRRCCGSGRLKSWYHRPAAPSAAPSVPPVAIRANGVPSIAADSFRSRARAGDVSARLRLEAADPRRREGVAEQRANRSRAACVTFAYANRSRRSLAARATRCGARAASGPSAPA